MTDLFIGLFLLTLAGAFVIPLLGVVWILFAELWDDHKSEMERRWKQKNK